MQKTFLMVKPDGVQRNLVGEVVSRLERKGYQLVGAKLMVPTAELAKEHYKEHADKPFFGELVEFITSGPVFASVWQGDGVIKVARTLIGATNPQEAAPGTIRGDFATSIGMNVVHGSDSPESAERELSIWFDENDVVNYEKTLGKWL